jgi:hypothetical protein
MTIEEEKLLVEKLWRDAWRPVPRRKAAKSKARRRNSL